MRGLSTGSMAIGAVALALVGAGCGGDDNDSTEVKTITQTAPTTPSTPSTPATTPSTPATTPQQTTPIEPMEQAPPDAGGGTPREQIEAAIHKELTDNQGFSESMADCVIQDLQEHVTDAEFANFIERLQKGESPDDFADAGKRCANA